MSYPKLTPIIAKGATEPRYLEDRFAEVINVKDFGAVGDGITDDTEAFIAACSLAEKEVIVPYTSEGYVVNGTIPVYCKLRGMGKPKITLTVSGDRGFWIKSGGGISDFTIYREVTGEGISGEYNNAIVVGEYYTDGTEYKNIQIANVELVGVNNEGDEYDRKSIMGIYGNSHDIFISNLIFKGYVSYGLMCHWGGVFDPENPHTSTVTASWHPRRIYIDGLRMTEPEPDSGLGMIYLSGCHDVTVANATASGVQTPIFIATGDCGGLVAQGESKQLILKNIRLENISISNYYGTGIFISGYSTLRAGSMWYAIDNNPSIVIDGITIMRGALSAGTTGSRCIDMRLVKNVSITGMNLSHIDNLYVDNFQPALMIRNCDNVYINGTTNVPVAHEIIGSTNITLDTKDVCLRSDYNTSCICTKLTGQDITATLAADVASNATSIQVSSLSADLVAGSTVTIGTFTMTLTKSALESTDPVTLHITPSLTSATSGSTVTLSKALENIEVRGSCYSFYKGLYATNANNGSAKSLNITRNFHRSGIYDIELRNSQNVSVVDCVFTNGGQLDSSSCTNIRVTDTCKDIDIKGCTFENNKAGSVLVRYNIYLDDTTVGGLICENKFFNVKSESIHVYIASGSPAPFLLVTDNWFASGISVKYTVSGMIRRSLIGDRQLCFYTAAPTVGTWEKGDIIFTSNPAAAGSIGWVCVTGGTPGTWKSFGTIAS